MKTLHRFFAGKPVTKTRDIAVLSLLIAMYVLLNSLTINLSATLRISFAFAPMAVSCWLFGFWPNVLFAFAADFLGFLVHPDGVYMPFFALILLLKVVIYTYFFYGKDKISVLSIVLALFFADLLGNVLLNPLLLMVLYKMPYWVLLTSRLLKNLICWPIESLVLWILFRFCTSHLRLFKPAAGRRSSGPGRLSQDSKET